MKKFLFACLLLIGVSVAVWILWQNFLPLCGNVKISEASSPNGMLIATVVKRNCGATTDYSTELIIRGSSAPIATGEDIPDAPLVLSGSYATKLIWKNDEHLIVLLPTIKILPSSDIITMATKWHGTTITYHRQLRIESDQ